MKVAKILFLTLLSFASYSSAAQIRKPIPTKYLSTYHESAPDKESAIELTRSDDFVFVVDLLPKNCDKTGKFDYTATIQRILTKHSKLVFPKFPLKINERGLYLQNNSILYFPEGSILLMNPSARSGYSILHLNKVSNVKLYFPTLIGDRKNHLGSKGEWGMGIKILSSKNIEIVGASISECWGDGIYVGSSGETFSEGILIRNSLIDYNRRNGISIISAKNVTITNNIISNTSGTQPMAGIDIEPNSNDDVISNIIIRDNLSYNNYNHGVLILLNRLKGVKSKNVSIVLSKHIDEHSTYGLGLSFPTSKRSGLPLTGKIVVDGSSWKSNAKKAIFNYSGSKINGLQFDFKNNQIVKDNGQVDYIQMKAAYEEFRALRFVTNQTIKHE